MAHKEISGARYTGKTEMKIYGRLLVLKFFRLFNVHFGGQKLRGQHALPPANLVIGLICLIGIFYSLLAFFPGWMSPDSVAQYSDARNNVYHDWHPVLMAWWWRRLDSVYSGPALFLLQNLILYWATWYFFANATSSALGRCRYLFPLLGFWPGLLFLMGEIWKDVAFASTLIFCWSLVFNAYMQRRSLLVAERIAVFTLCVFAFGIKTNGIVALPFILFFWVYTEGWHRRKWLIQAALALGLCSMCVLTAMIVTYKQKIVTTFPFQYTQTYDLLGISVRTGKSLLPEYITERVGGTPEKLKTYYFPGGNNLLFYGIAGAMHAKSPPELADLDGRWRHAVIEFPKDYLLHRLDNFSSLMRWGEKTTAVVASPSTVENPYGVSFQGNNFSTWLASQADSHPWMFFPWIYAAILGIATSVLIVLKWHRVFVLTVAGSALAFVFPHIFIAPSADYRYLYYSYFCALVLGLLALTQLAAYLRELAKRFF